MRMHDGHVDLSGFLEGSPEVPLRWTCTVLSTEPTVDDWRSIEYYRIRAREYLANVGDLPLGRTRSLSIDSGGDRASISTSSYPGRHRAKSLYLDYRHFLANNEPSKFEKVVNVLRRHLAANEPIHDFLVQLKDRFRSAEGNGVEIAGAKLETAELINIWFNTEFFHAGREEQVLERERWLKIIDDEGVHHMMYWAVVGAAHEIKTLYACVKDLDRHGQRTVHCPDLRIMRR